jgi:hypothetical protein
MLDGDGLQGERVVLARKEPRTMVGFQWTGQEPAGLNEPEFAEALGAVWEGDLLVTYNLDAFKHAFDHYSDEFLTDPD